MVEMTYYQKLVDLHQISSQIRERVPTSCIVNTPRRIGFVHVANDSIDPIFRFIHWMCNPYQPVGVIVDPMGYPDDYLEQVHHLLASTYAVELMVGGDLLYTFHIATTMYSYQLGDTEPIHLIYKYSRLFIPPNIQNFGRRRVVYFDWIS
jgi:hypothetical protein